MDMAQFSKDSKAQARERLQWILDVVREHQDKTLDILTALIGEDIPDKSRVKVAKWILSGMHKNDRDAILQENGILTPRQIELLTKK